MPLDGGLGLVVLFVTFLEEVVPILYGGGGSLWLITICNNDFYQPAAHQPPYLPKTSCGGFVERCVRGGLINLFIGGGCVEVCVHGGLSINIGGDGLMVVMS